MSLYGLANHLARGGQVAALGRRQLGGPDVTCSHPIDTEKRMTRTFTFRTSLLAPLAGAAAFALGAACASSSASPRVPARSAGSTPAGPRLSLLAPTGRYRVGTVSIPVADPSRHGETMVQLFYPTLLRHGRPAPYLPPRTTHLTAAALHLPVALVAAIVTHAFAAAPPVPGVRPVVLFSPGLTELRSDATALDEELASRGFVVVAIDHAHEAAFVEFPNGRVIPGTFVDSSNPRTSSRLRAQAVHARIGDVAAVLHALAKIDSHGLLRGRLDLSRIGMFGFSLGGATTGAAMRALPQIRAGVDLDGSLYGRSLTTPLSRPFLILARDGHSTVTDPSWRRGWATLRGWRREIRLIGAGHGDFGDDAAFIRQLAPGSTDPTGYYGPINPDRATTAIRQVLVAFFDRFMLGDRAGNRLLDTPARRNPDLLRLR
jgi:dienelactone hydrolase